MSAFSILGAKFRCLTGAFLSAIFTFSPLTLGAKEIGILVDRSMSVDQANRDEAVRLVTGLLDGEVDPDIRSKWRLIKATETETDPEQQEMKSRELQQLGGLIENRGASGITSGPFKLMLGEFGDLETVNQLARATWEQAGDNAGPRIREWAAAITPSDKETHFQLARATAAARLADASEFYFFVVSDGVEDLVNWPVSDYLDPAKLSNEAALEAGDFRDSAKARRLEVLNLKRSNGEDVKLGGKIRPGYQSRDRATIDAFRSRFTERLVGRFTLTAPELRNFFSTKPGKVPVNVYIYSARPKDDLQVRFTLPASSSPEQPHPVSFSASELKWLIDYPPGTKAADFTLELTLVDSKANGEVATRPVSGNGTKLFDTFPEVKNGPYELRLSATRPGHKPGRGSAYIEVRRSAPELRFIGDLEEADERADARKYDPRRDQNILGRKIEWEWTSDDPELGPPTKIERSLAYFEAKGADSRPLLDSTATLPKVTTSLPLNQLLVVGEHGSEPLPLGGTYRLTLRATWPDGSQAVALAWMSLPEPDLTILGRSNAAETPDSPRSVHENDLIKIGNWMHQWRGFEYDLTLFRKEGNDWVRITDRSSDLPLQLETQEGGQIAVKVVKPIPSVLKYEVSFGPADEGERDMIEMPSAEGYVETSGTPLLPWILGALGLLTIGFFGWHVFRRR